jgi:hypothetical protein
VLVAAASGDVGAGVWEADPAAGRSGQGARAGSGAAVRAVGRVVLARGFAPGVRGTAGGRDRVAGPGRVLDGEGQCGLGFAQVPGQIAEQAAGWSAVILPCGSVASGAPARSRSSGPVKCQPSLRLLDGGISHRLRNMKSRVG